MGPVNLKEARARLSDLVRAVEKGESVLITRRGRIVARLVPPATSTERPKAPDLAPFREALEIREDEKGLSRTVIENRREGRY
jgi:prevent-host-death family protein